MVSNCNVEADGILVLCFLNSAVDEIKERLKKFVAEENADRGLINVDVRTFHSFAWWLIDQANSNLADKGWSYVKMESLNYTESLIYACRILERYGDDVVRGWKYFIVDEIQDLTNTKGLLVLKIIDACLLCNCGVTVMGDTCQAIFDNVNEKEKDTEEQVLKSNDFYKLLFKTLYGKARFVRLMLNRRQEEKLINLTTELREAIIFSDPNKAAHAVKVIESSTGQLGVEQKNNLSSIGYLFWSNGEMLTMSAKFRKQGIPHSLNVKDSQNHFAPWIADVFSKYNKDSITGKTFLKKYKESCGEGGEYVWKCLKRLLHTESATLKVRDLLDAIAVCRIDDSIFRVQKKHKYVLSTIHRSKGREYDCVVMNSADVRDLSSDKQDNMKLLYVAVTRPKKHLIIDNLIEKYEVVYNLQIPGTKRSRCRRNEYGSDRITCFELDTAQDLGCNRFINVSSEIIDSISVGDAIEIERRLLRESGQPTINYIVVHKKTGNPICCLTMDDVFVNDLMLCMGITTDTFDRMPALIQDIYVSGIYSQVVNKEYLESHPGILDKTPNGVWKWIEIVGIGHLQY